MNIQQKRYFLEQGYIASQEIGNAQTAEVSVVFLHGWLDNSSSFLTTINELSWRLSGAHLCAIDLPGHGLSSHKSNDNFYPFHDYIDDIYQLLLNLSPNRLVLVGHSLGALIASCYSAAFPEQVAGLIQIEGVGPLAESPDKSVTRLRNGVLSRQRIRRKPKRSLPTLEDAIARRSAVNHLDTKLIRPVVERGIEQRGEQWVWRHDVKLNSDSLFRMSFEHARQFSGQIPCPHRVILGDQGFGYLKQNCDCLVNNHCEMFTISGGHHCHLEQPSQVAELIFGLVNKI
ncbi:Hydrolase [Vibrio aestuarianus]|nr:Hydrolase [Vibrio aestuarianus]